MLATIGGIVEEGTIYKWGEILDNILKKNYEGLRTWTIF